MDLNKMNEELKKSKKINAFIDINEIKKVDENFTEKITSTTNKLKNEAENKEEHVEEHNVEFDNLVKKYKEIDNEIRDYQKKVSSLKKQNKILHDKIIIHLEKMGETQIHLLDGKLSINSYKTTPALKIEYVEETIKNQFKDESKTKELLEQIEIKKEKASKITKQLKRTFNRSKK
jgi:hypothetical protein